MSSRQRVDPRIRALGKARIDITRRAKDEQDWQRQWREPRYPFPFSWSRDWKHSIQYKVDDYAAEIGFWIDVLGLPVCAFSPSYAMFTSPAQDFSFSVVAALEGEQSTPPDTLRIQFMVSGIFKLSKELENRGIIFEQSLQPHGSSGSSLFTGYFRTPHGICVDLMGIAEAGEGLQEGKQEDVQRDAPQKPAAEISEDELFFEMMQDGEELSEAGFNSGDRNPEMESELESRPEEESLHWPEDSPWLEMDHSSGTPAASNFADPDEDDLLEEEPPTNSLSSSLSSFEEKRTEEDEPLEFGEPEAKDGSLPWSQNGGRSEELLRPDLGRPNELFSRLNPFDRHDEPRRNGAGRRQNPQRHNRILPGKNPSSRPNGSHPAATPPRPNSSTRSNPDGHPKSRPQLDLPKRTEEEPDDFPFPFPEEEEEELKYENLDDLEGMDDSGDLYP